MILKYFSVGFLLEFANLKWFAENGLLLQQFPFLVFVGYLQSVDVPTIAVNVLTVRRAESHTVKGFVLLRNQTSFICLSHEEVEQLGVGFL